LVLPRRRDASVVHCRERNQRVPFHSAEVRIRSLGSAEKVADSTLNLAEEVFNLVWGAPEPALWNSVVAISLRCVLG
jgi:hypothetical protein